MIKKCAGLMLLLAAISIILFTAGGAPPGGAPPGGAPPSGSIGRTLPDSLRKNVEFSYNGWISKITDEYIEIRCCYKTPNHDWWQAPMRIDIGPQTVIMDGALEIGQLVQITGIYPENGVNFTTNYEGFLPGLVPTVRRGTIEIIKQYKSPL